MIVDCPTMVTREMLLKFVATASIKASTLMDGESVADSRGPGDVEEQPLRYLFLPLFRITITE